MEGCLERQGKRQKAKGKTQKCGGSELCAPKHFCHLPFAFCLLIWFSSMPTVFGRDYPSTYDAIIIGSGIGGLFCGNILAKAGLKVLLLEKHYMLGGFCSTFRRRGFIF